MRIYYFATNKEPDESSYFETENFYKNQIQTWPQICHPCNHRKKQLFQWKEGRSWTAGSKTFQATPTSSGQAVKTFKEGRNYKGAQALEISPDLLQLASLLSPQQLVTMYTFVCFLHSF